MLLGQTGDGSSYAFPEQASEFAHRTDEIFFGIFWISMFFFVLIITLTVYFCFKYRRREGQDALPSPSHNTWLEVTWTVLPTLLLVWMFWAGAQQFLELRTPPPAAKEIVVQASQWSWQFTYPDGSKTTDVLHLPVNQPVKFRLISTDVLHSFFIPEFRQKWDVIPGQYNSTWVKPIRTSDPDQPFRLYCTEYCGNEHSEMKADVHVHNKTWDEIYEQHTIFKPGEIPHENGLHYFTFHGCQGCHSIDGTRKVGPTLKDAWGEMRDTDKGQVKFDENYVRESILEPNATVRNGFGPTSQMPSRYSSMSNDEIEYLIAYIKFINGIESDAPSSEKKEPEEGASEDQPSGESGTQTSNEKSQDDATDNSQDDNSQDDANTDSSPDQENAQSDNPDDSANSDAAGSNAGRLWCNRRRCSDWHR